MRSPIFEKGLAIDCETSGFNRSSKDPSDKYQSVSWGAIVFNSRTFEPLEELYVEIQWDKESYWDAEAEKIHGLSKSYLAENGLQKEDAAGEIVELILRHWDINDSISLLGHNVMRFDLPFLRKLLHEAEMPLKFSHRSMDTFSLSMGTIQEFTSDDIFKALNIKRGVKHNSLEDAHAALAVFRKIHKIWDKVINDGQ